MKKFGAILISMLLLLCSNVSAQKIEQVYSRLPEIKAYVTLDNSNDKNSIAGYMDSEPLSLDSVKEFNREDGISYILMFDCSTSVTDSQLTKMKQTATDFISSNKVENDKFIIVSFGKTIDILADANSSKNEAISAINSLNNNQTATVLFDAVNAIKNISAGLDSSCPKKYMSFVFTDTVDYTVGGITQAELMNTAASSPFPIYVIAIDGSNKESVDTLGQVARSSGGDVFVAQNGNIGNAFADACEEIDKLYEISFHSASNVMSNEPFNLRIQVGNSYIEKKFNSSSWEKDLTSPYIEKHEINSGKTIVIYFSENVENAQEISNYTLKKGDADIKIANVLYDSTVHTATISCEDALGNGKYTISTANIVDCSMEKNTMQQAYDFEVTGFSAAMVNFNNFLKHFWWVIVIVIFIIAALIILWFIKKRKGIVLVDGKPVFADNVKYESKRAKPLPQLFLQLIMEDASKNTTKLDINITQSVIFGRAASCEVTIDDASLSRQHFAIELENHLLFIQNLSQTNGTLLNGIELNAKRRLTLGDVIMAGQEKFTVNKIN